jgi:hypothetical protein
MYLKPLSVDAIPSALVNAERYRFLNEPGEAESICLDVLAVDPANQAARVMLILALTDQLLDEPGALPKARALAAELDDAYEREYYAGLVCERRARAQVARGGHGSSEVAREWLKDALVHYDKAEPLRAPGNDDAILRWNACVRLIEQCPESDVSDDPRLLMLE